uniref:2Fe-2S ferredoxin-type domain-containing protein n=1 Tax=Aegilops tauschii subsp. strangulata TaxID=200361 RepID=A0A453R0U1_AEGTS
RRRGRRPAAGSHRFREGSEAVGSAAAMLSRISQLGARGSCARPELKSILFSTATTSSHHDEGGDDKEKISVTFVNKDGTEKTISVPVGMSMLEAAHENDIELEGACEGSLACSTCHVIVMDVKDYNKLEDPTDEENDMLDLAFGLTETSRLGCQVIAKPELDGVRLALPAATRNFAVDGFVPKPH